MCKVRDAGLLRHDIWDPAEKRPCPPCPTNWLSRTVKQHPIFQSPSDLASVWRTEISSTSTRTRFSAWPRRGRCSLEWWEWLNWSNYRDNHQVIENAEFHSSDESSDEEEAVKAGQVYEFVLLSPYLRWIGEGCLVPKWNRGGCHREESPFGG